jgi:hypothetical protein
MEDFQLKLQLSGGLSDVIQTMLQHNIILLISRQFDEQKSAVSSPEKKQSK